MSGSYWHYSMEDGVERSGGAALFLLLTGATDALARDIDDAVVRAEIPDRDRNDLREAFVRSFAARVYPALDATTWVTTRELMRLPAWPWRSLRQTQESIRKWEREGRLRVAKGERGATIVHAGDAISLVGKDFA